jgi:hypothetical protein
MSGAAMEVQREQGLVELAAPHPQLVGHDLGGMPEVARRQADL